MDASVAWPHRLCYVTMDIEAFPTLQRRFVGKVDRSGGPDACWPWRGTTNTRGYGMLATARGTSPAYAHRVAFEIAFGYRPTVVMHSCDNPRCCNPSHLSDGTAARNARQSVERGRHATGQRARAKLSMDAAREIRRIGSRRRGRPSGTQQTYMDIAAAFGVHPETVGAIMRGETYSE